MAKDELLV